MTTYCACSFSLAFALVLAFSLEFEALLAFGPLAMLAFCVNGKETGRRVGAVKKVTRTGAPNNKKKQRGFNLFFGETMFLPFHTLRVVVLTVVLLSSFVVARGCGVVDGTDTPTVTGTKVLFNGQHQVITLNLYESTQIAQMIFSGSPKNWYGIGYGGQVMNNTYAIIVDGYGNVTERLLGNHEPGTLLKPSVTVTSDLVNASLNARVVTLTRPMQLAYPYYSFDVTTASIPIIWAHGTTPDLESHGPTNDGVGQLDMAVPLLNF